MTGHKATNSTSMLRAILKRVVLIDTKVDNLGEKLSKRIDDLDEKLTSRLDKQGKSLAYLEDDAPTIKSHHNLKKRVKKLEVKVFEVI